MQNRNGKKAKFEKKIVSHFWTMLVSPSDVYFTLTHNITYLGYFPSFSLKKTKDTPTSRSQWRLGQTPLSRIFLCCIQQVGYEKYSSGKEFPRGERAMIIGI